MAEATPNATPEGETATPPCSTRPLTSTQPTMASSMHVTLRAVTRSWNTTDEKTITKTGAVHRSTAANESDSRAIASL